MPLRNILRQGIAENHFHLYGSAPMFHLSWLSLMNNVLMTKAAENLYRFDHDRRRSNIRFGDLYEENSLVAQFYQAAMIRIFLFSVLTEDGTAVSTCDNSEGKGLLTFTKVMELLNDNYLMQEQLVEIQSLIDVFRFIPHGAGNGKEDNLQDYALLGVKQRHGSSNDIFAGERWFLYSCLYQIYRARFSDEYENLFYAYLLIKENIRSEMIQSNSNVGFVNFNKYETRKWGLMDNAIFGNEVVRAAVNGNMLSEHLRSLEIRISPKNTAKEDMQMIRRLDTIIGEPREKYFYTVHFIKGEDKTPYQSGILQCRQEQKRSEVHRKASALIEFRERFPKCACRVLGIDAAANEIGCRPEVFAPEFRRLRNHVKTLEDSLSGKRVPQLRVTYHVGEDFLDLPDGLRAIDEAVNFLNMDCGDRLGHAMALGVDVEEWYSSKNNRILISQQDYLDNLAWMYNRLIEYKISDVDVLKDYLLKKYAFYFDRIYARYMDYGLVDAILEKARIKYREKNITNAFHNDRYRFEIFQYYNAWKLRGDDPNLYAYGYFWWEDEDIPEVSYRVNLKFPGKFSMRYRPEVFLINYYYQYEEQVRIEGSRRIEIKIKPEYIRGVKLLQKEMQKDIGRRGIAIETNPSSNFLIGTFKDYAKHPILNFYNRNLTDDFDRLRDCPQLSVSVNTDDQGVFSTSLENEYSLLANALENAVDEDGHYIYNRTMIYSWIDDIRKMGINQSFVVDTAEYGKLLNEKSKV